LFVVFGVSYLTWDHLIRRRDAWLPIVSELAIFFCGVSLPVALTGFALWWAGVFGKFWFCTFTYAREYALEVPFSSGIHAFSSTFPRIVGPNLAIWMQRADTQHTERPLTESSKEQ
jgi:hypothetical protein